MSKYRIINTKPHQWDVEKRHWGFWIKITGWSIWKTYDPVRLEIDAEALIDKLVLKEQWIPKPPRIYP